MRILWKSVCKGTMIFIKYIKEMRGEKNEKEY